MGHLRNISFFPEFDTVQLKQPDKWLFVDCIQLLSNIFIYVSLNTKLLISELYGWGKGNWSSGEDVLYTQMTLLTDWRKRLWQLWDVRVVDLPNSFCDPLIFCITSLLILPYLSSYTRFRYPLSESFESIKRDKKQSNYNLSRQGNWQFTKR